MCIPEEQRWLSPCQLHSCKANYTKQFCLQLVFQQSQSMLNIQHHSEAPVSPEQRGAYRSTSASTVRRQLAPPDAALAAC